jgi:hypothetical protein
MLDAAAEPISNGYHVHLYYDAVDDHSRYAVRLGKPVTVKLATMNLTYRTEQFPTI